jgi:hypothetical protein
VDLIAIEPNGAVVAYEVKSTGSHRLSLNTSYGRSQFLEHLCLSRRISVLYAVRFTVKGSPVWRLFRISEGFDLRLSVDREDGIPL